MGDGKEFKERAVGDGDAFELVEVRVFTEGRACKICLTVWCDGVRDTLLHVIYVILTDGNGS